MPKAKELKCYFGCLLNGPLHRFPKWDYPHTEKFEQWKSILNPATIARGNDYIYNNVRLCYRHFQIPFQLPSHRLTKNAVPTLNIFSLRQSEELPSTSATLDLHEDTDISMAPSAGADSFLFKMTSKVQTVLGDVSPSELGRTLTHEHLGMNFEHFYRQPPPTLAGKFTGSDLELETIGYVRQYPYSLRYNLKLDDDPAEQAVLYDVIEYKTAGGGTIVENTTEGINRHLSFYQTVSRASNVHIVAGTGHYIADLQSGATLTQSTEDVYNHMMQELTKGCVTQPDVKAGFMGEIASVWPLRDFERRAIQAAGELQPQLGCGVSFHPHRTKEAPFEIIRLYLEAGGSADKVVMSHLDRTLVEDEILLEFAELGTYCQFDLFGTEVSYYQLEVTTDMLSDAQRIQKISLLVEEGREDKILMSHDIHTKHRLTKFGGHGYAHIINNVLPKMISKGFTKQQIDNITIGNPARWLAIEHKSS